MQKFTLNSEGLTVMEDGQCASLDVHVIIGCSDETTHHYHAINLLKDKGIKLVVPPSVLRRLYALRKQGIHTDDAFHSLLNPEFETVHLDESDLEIIEAKAIRLQELDVFRGANLSELRTLVEAAYLRSNALITSCPYLLDEKSANMALLACDIRPITISSSRNIVKFFQRGS